MQATRQQRAATAAVPQQAEVATPVRSNQVNVGNSLFAVLMEMVCSYSKVERHYLRRKT